MANSFFGNFLKGKGNDSVDLIDTEEKIIDSDELSEDDLGFVGQNPAHSSLVIDGDSESAKERYSKMGSKELATLPEETLRFLRDNGLIDENLLREADAKLAAEEKKVEAELRSESALVNSNPSNIGGVPQVEVPKKELTPEEKIAKLEEQVSSLTDAMKTQQELIKQLMTHTNVIQTSNDDVTTYDSNVDDNNKSK